MMNDSNDAPMVDLPKRNPSKWKKNKGDNFSNKAKKQWKKRERELEEDDLDRDLRDYK